MLGRIVNTIEEDTIALLLGLMTLLTFGNVVARYLFNFNILWALELSVYMFAWLVLLGVSYAVKVGVHLGVDAVLALVGPKTRRVMGLVSAAACLIFVFLMLKGAWDYWANFANLPDTTGRWFPLGFDDNFRPKGWYETSDIPMIAPLNFLQTMFNDGEPYEKLPRVIPYMVLPISMALLLFRFAQATVRLWRGEITSLIVSHEAEDAVEEAARRVEADQ